MEKEIGLSDCGGSGVFNIGRPSVGAVTSKLAAGAANANAVN